jgi:ATP-binding cassette subfamily B protein
MWNLKFDEAREKITLDKKIIEDTKITLEVNNLEFEYNQNNLLFKNLNFKIQQADILVIKGESGTGKSTLLSLVLGLFLPTKGEVMINGISTRNYKIDLQQVLAYVGPEPYIIPGTVRENLLYGLENKKSITDTELWSALESMELKELVFKLPLKLNEPIHDIPQLSTGQKQRLSFARALVRKPSLLILDEATANLDSVTEKKILDNLQHLFKKCTSIIVTHKNTFDSLATHTLDLSRNND